MSFSGQCTAYCLIMSWVNNKRNFSWVSMRLWRGWHRFLAQWLVMAEGLCTAESLTGKGSHVCRFGKTCCKPPGLSNPDRWQGAVPKKRVRVKSWRLVNVGALHPPLLSQHHDSALIRGVTCISHTPNKSRLWGCLLTGCNLILCPYEACLCFYVFLHICQRTV